MKILKNDEIQKLRKEFPQGTKVKLIKMNDVQSPEPATIGFVIGVDDIGTIHVQWETGGVLGLIVGEDEFEKL